MTSILPSLLESYITNYSDDEPKLLAELSHQTYLKQLQPHMLSGHYQGRLLSIISRLIQPKHILDIGTYTGYSTLCLAEGLATDGEVHTIDINEELREIQDSFFKKSVYSDQIISYTGDALDIIPKMTQTFDLVFIDADKTYFCEYLDVVIDKVRKGGCILSDNVLWKGRVYNDDKGDKKQTKMIEDYNEKAKKDSRISSVILPIRDGLMLSIVN